MITTINLYNFQDAFQAIRPDSFSRGGLRALYDYLEQLEEDRGEPIELDVISLWCDWTEWESLAEYQECYGADVTMEDIEYVTEVIYIDGTDAFIALDH
jgi:hypothetical protein